MHNKIQGQDTVITTFAGQQEPTVILVYTVHKEALPLQLPG
jgi:hypothetical protein